MRKLAIEVQDAIKQFTGLRLIHLENELLVSGLFTAFEKYKGELIEIDTFNIEIRFTKSYPFRFPLIKETGSKIPKNEDRHINSDGTLCLGNLQDEMRFCRSGITFKEFLIKILNPHLCREYFRERRGYYPNGERSHGYEGIWETYYELLETRDKKLIITELDLILQNLNFEVRNKLCYCDSGKKYKRCHLIKKGPLLDIGVKNLRLIFQLLKDDFLKSKKGDI